MGEECGSGAGRPTVPPSVQQNVTAVGGFAYGVVGASVHVFGDGLPLYVLEEWRPPADTDPEFLRELPSRMLNARFAVVEFTGRRDELADLHRWCRDGPRLAGCTVRAGRASPGSHPASPPRPSMPAGR
ncbi:hypothetical protein RKD35_000236 [Streptomyces albogriseolus]